MKGNIVHSSPTIGIKRESIRNANKLIAVSGGKKRLKQYWQQKLEIKIVY